MSRLVKLSAVIGVALLFFTETAGATPITPHSELGAFDVLGDLRTTVPEPTTGLLTGSALALLSMRVRSRRRPKQ